jgi:hypothetical protein
MIDNIVIGGMEGAEEDFYNTIRILTARIGFCNIQSEPSVRDLEQMSLKSVISTAANENTFLGETYVWNATTKERETKNSNKTIAKLMVASRQSSFSYRSLAAYISLLLYMHHTLHLNPANLFPILCVYRGIGVEMSKQGSNWDLEVPYISAQGQEAIKNLTQILLANNASPIPSPKVYSYEDNEYDEVIFIDASKEGWGAVRKRKNLPTLVYQQKFIHYIQGETKESDRAATFFTANFSAHAEPTAARLFLQFMMRRDEHFATRKIAMVTDHIAIVRAQKKQNGFGGIARGKDLNSLFFIANRLNIVFFYIRGEENPADTFSRNFPEEALPGHIDERQTNTSTPPLSACFSPLCEVDERPKWMI